MALDNRIDLAGDFCEVLFAERTCGLYHTIGFFQDYIYHWFSRFIGYQLCLLDWFDEFR
jgi:hypothetical protein